MSTVNVGKFHPCEAGAYNELVYRLVKLSCLAAGLFLSMGKNQMTQMNQMTSSTLGGAEGSVSLLLTKTYPCAS